MSLARLAAKREGDFAPLLTHIEVDLGLSTAHRSCADMTKQILGVIDLMARQIAKAIQIFDTRVAIQPAVAIGGRVGLLARTGQFLLL